MPETITADRLAYLSRHCDALASIMANDRTNDSDVKDLRASAEAIREFIKLRERPAQITRTMLERGVAALIGYITKNLPANDPVVTMQSMPAVRIHHTQSVLSILCAALKVTDTDFSPTPCDRCQGLCTTDSTGLLDTCTECGAERA